MRNIKDRTGAQTGETLASNNLQTYGTDEWLFALQEGIKVFDLTNAIDVYSTYSVADTQAASEIRINRFLNGISGKVVRSLARLWR